MSIFQLTTDTAGQVGFLPRRCKLVTSDDLATITAPGYLNQSKISPQVVYADDFFDVCYSATTLQGPGTNDEFVVTISDGVTTLVPFVSPNLHTITQTTALAAPGTVRALTASMTNTATVMTSGNVVGVRGETHVVGASGGFVYGTQGKVFSTGTLSGSSWTAALFGQFDLSAATITNGQLAPVWADYGTSATSGTYSGARMFAGTNTTAAILGSQIYLYGGATNLFDLVDNNAGVGATYVLTPAGATPSGNLRTLTVSINGATYKILAAQTYS